jgi:hypothetical protein
VYSATITTYSNLSNWQAATTGLQIITFEGLAPAGGSTIYPGGISQNGVQFVGLSGSTIGVLDTSAFSWANFSSNDAGFATGGTESVHIALPAGINAFGLNLFASPQSFSYTATVLGTPYVVPTFNSPTEAFFGVTSDTTIPSVDLALQSGGSYAFFDNFQWGSTQATEQTPEADTFLMICLGLLALASIRGRARLPRHL